jgi:hypothetical protein
MWVLVALAVAELLVVHLLVALLWSRAIALVLTLLTLAAIAGLVAFVRSFRRLPVLVDGERVVMRVGFKPPVEVAMAQVAAVRTDFSAADTKAAGVVNLALLAFPNVLVELRSPVVRGQRKRPVRAIAHRLDDPAGFRAALAPPRR